MFCPNCGKQIPDDAKFCVNCGAQPTAAASQSAPVKETKKKKKPNLLLVVVVVAICFIAGRALGGSMADSYQDDPVQSGQSTQSIPSGDSGLVSSGGGEYDKIFSDRNIVTAPAFFGTMDSAAYANVDADGNVDHLQFGYQDDTVVQMVETVYIPVEGWSDTDKAALDTNLREAYAAAEDLSFVSVSYNSGYSFYSVTMTLKDLDVAANLQAAVDAGLLSLTEESTNTISMSATESALLAQGYVKK